MPMQRIPAAFAVFAALTTFFELPDVLMAISTSKGVLA